MFGSSCSGKSSTVDSVRERNDVRVPKRFVTRGNRLRDNLLENSHVTDALFNRMVLDGQIEHPWQRDLGPDSGIAQYGFERVEERGGSVAVYSGNNDFVRSPSGRHLLAAGAWPVLIQSERAVRERRMLARSPDLADSERQKRLGDEPTDLLDIPGLVVIENVQIDLQGATLAARLFNHLIDIIQEDKPRVGELVVSHAARICRC